MVVFKEIVSLFATTVPAPASSLSSFNPCFRVEVDRGTKLFQFFDECFSAGHALHFAIRHARPRMERCTGEACWVV
jgi:hypothetical protein